MRRLLPRRAAIAALAILTAAACAPLAETGLVETDPVEVTVVDLLPSVEGTESGAPGQAWLVTFDVANRGGEDLAIRAMDVEMRLGGSDLGRGRSEERFRLPPYGGARVTVAIEGTWLGLARQFLNLAERRALDWQARGTLETEPPSSRTLRFYDEGALLGEDEGW